MQQLGKHQYGIETTIQTCPEQASTESGRSGRANSLLAPSKGVKIHGLLKEVNHVANSPKSYRV
jgi:hypothetical protein